MGGIIQKDCAVSVTVRPEDVDAAGYLRLSSVLLYHQDAAEAHLAPGDLGWTGMLRRGMVFVTSRWHCAVTRLPRMGETVSLCTWHRERRGPRFLRCFEWRGADGALLMSSVMQYALVTVPEHRLLRGEEFDAFGVPTHSDRQTACADPAGFTLPPLEPAGEYTVLPGDIDLNEHMNNSRYGDLAAGCLRQDERPADIALHFAGECRLGDVLRLESARQEGAVYVSGKVGDRTAFTARIQLAQGVRDGV